MLCKEVIAATCENYMKSINTIFDQSAEISSFNIYTIHPHLASNLKLGGATLLLPILWLYVAHGITTFNFKHI